MILLSVNNERNFENVLMNHLVSIVSLKKIEISNKSLIQPTTR